MCKNYYSILEFLVLAELLPGESCKTYRFYYYYYYCEIKCLLVVVFLTFNNTVKIVLNSLALRSASVFSPIFRMTIKYCNFQSFLQYFPVNYAVFFYSVVMAMIVTTKV